MYLTKVGSIFSTLSTIHKSLILLKIDYNGYFFYINTNFGWCMKNHRPITKSNQQLESFNSAQ